MKNIAQTIIRILLLGLLIHFVVLTWLEYRMDLSGLSLTAVALWKEILLVLWAARLWVQHHKHIIQLRKSDSLFRIITLLLFGTIAMTIAISAGWGYELGSYIAAFKYNLMWFGVWWLAYISGTMMTRWEAKRITKRYIIIIKIALVLSVIWYAALVVKPWTLKYLWYSKTTYEWSLNKQPPAVYYSEMTSGIQRNQFVFERPITYGFWLIAFWPLFFVVILRNKRLEDTWFWWLLYTMWIVLTFSRAAWWAWLLEVAILWYWTYQSTFRQFANKILIPAIVVIVGVWYLGFHEIFWWGRQFSNTWHINALITSIQAVWEHPLFGWGPGSVGPASHHFWLGYNTENQFLQVWIEYGLFWLVWWLLLFSLPIVWGLWLRSRHHKSSKESDYLIAYGIGMIGLAVSWLVLHSWVDRQIVRPMMLMIGMWWGVFIADKQENYNEHNKVSYPKITIPKMR